MYIIATALVLAGSLLGIYTLSLFVPDVEPDGQTLESRLRK